MLVHRYIFTFFLTVSLRRISQGWRAWLAKTGAQFSTYDTEQKLAGLLPRWGAAYLSRTMYSRLFLSELLPLEISRALYLDCDVICVGNLRKLWSFGSAVALMAAVRDVWVDKRQEHKVSLGMPVESTYFNSGVLLINVEAWRRNKVGERLLDFLSQREKSDYGDQDIINAVLWRETVELPRRWNVGITSPIPGDAQAQLKSAKSFIFGAASAVAFWLSCFDGHRR